MDFFYWARLYRVVQGSQFLWIGRIKRQVITAGLPSQIGILCFDVTLAAATEAAQYVHHIQNWRNLDRAIQFH